MPMMLQADAAPPLLPWWVLYILLVGILYGTWRITRLAWWGGCLAAVAGTIILFTTAVLTIPQENFALVLGLPLVTVFPWFLALKRHHQDVSPRAEIAARLPERVARRLTPGVMQGQPSPRAVLRAKVMADRYAAGLPRDAAFIARLRYVSGLPDASPRPVDLFAGDGRLWVAPLASDPLPSPIPLRDVLRVDVWPELEGPPTLRVNWSPPAAEGTRDLVLAAMPNVPAPLIQPQLEAIAGVLTGLLRARGEAEEAAVVASDAPEEEAARACPRCGEQVPAGAAVCPRCILRMPPPGER